MEHRRHAVLVASFAVMAGGGGDGHDTAGLGAEEVRVARAHIQARLGVSAATATPHASVADACRPPAAAASATAAPAAVSPCEGAMRVASAACSAVANAPVARSRVQAAEACAHAVNTLASEACDAALNTKEDRAAGRCVAAVLSPASSSVSVLPCSGGCLTTLHAVSRSCGGFIPRMMAPGEFDTSAPQCASALTAAQVACPEGGELQQSSSKDAFCAGLLSFAPSSLVHAFRSRKTRWAVRHSWSGEESSGVLPASMCMPPADDVASDAVNLKVGRCMLTPVLEPGFLQLTPRLLSALETTKW